MNYPEFPLHPEPRSFAWSKLETACIEKYAKACVDADRAQRAAPVVPAPGVQGGEQALQAARDAVAEALGDAYDCTRVWSAWGVGTMDQDDFVLISGDAERVAEITDAAVGAFVAAQPPQQSAQPVAGEINTLAAWASAVIELLRRAGYAEDAKGLAVIEQLISADLAMNATHATTQPVEVQRDITKSDVLQVAKEVGLVTWVSECGTWFQFADLEQTSPRLIEFAKHFAHGIKPTSTEES